MKSSLLLLLGIFSSQLLISQVLLPTQKGKTSISDDRIPEYIFLDSTEISQLNPEGKVNVFKDQRLDFLIEQYNENKTIEGYRIQLYSGRKREDAMQVRSDFKDIYPNINAHLIYQQPNFKVRIGDFTDRLSATKFFRNIRTSYPSSFVIRDEISLSADEEIKD